jgi:hypothetical protein
MFTGPLQQLQTLTESQRRAHRQDEGERLCRNAEIPTESLENRQVLSEPGSSLWSGLQPKFWGRLATNPWPWLRKLTRTGRARTV